MSSRAAGWLVLVACVPCGCAMTHGRLATPQERGAIAAALARSPERGDLWRDLGWIDLIAGDGKRAAEEFQRAAKQLPDDPRVLLGRAAQEHVAGRIGAARDSWAAILEHADQRDPWSGPCEEYAASALEWTLGDAPGERALAERLARIDPRRLVGWAAPARLQAARAVLARKQGDEESGRRLDGERGCPSRWRVTGPWGQFARLDLARQLPPEPSQPLAGRAVTTRGGQFTVATPDGRAGVMHAYTFVSAPRDLKATVVVETDQPWHLVIDGRVVWQSAPPERFPAHRQALTVALAAGWHKVIVALAVPHARTDAVVSLVGEGGAPLVFSDQPPASLAGRALGQAAIALDPPPPTEPRSLADFLLGERALRDGDLDGGEAAIEPLIERAPKFVPGLLLAAQLAAEDPSRPARFARDRARRLLERALALEPLAVRARYNLAMMDLQDDHAEKALATLAGGSGWRTDYARFEALRSRGWMPEAEHALDEARRENPEACPPIEAAVAVARERHDVVRERGRAIDLVRCQPSSDDLAEVLRDTDDPKGAAVEWRRLLALEPDRDAFRSGLADALLSSGDAAGAIKELESLVAEHPRTAGFRIKLADALVAGGDSVRATRVIAEGLAEAPEAMELHRALLALGGGNPIDPFRVDGRAVIAAFERSGRHFQSPAVIVLDRTVTRVFPNGARLTLTHNIIRVQTKDGIDKWGEVSIPEGADVLLLRAVKADGTTREPEEIAEKQSVSVPDLEPGDYVEFEFIDPAPAPAAFPSGFLAERFYFQSFDAPLDRTEYVVASPVGMALQVDSRGAAPTGKMDRQGDLEVRTWSDHDKQQLVPEPQQTPFTETVPSVRVASAIDFAGWRDFLLDQQFGVLRGNGELRALAQRLKTPEAIDGWVRRNVKQGGSLEESATSILARGEGNRITLERALLGAVKIPSEVWLVRPSTAAVLDGALPDLEGFDEALLALSGPVPGVAAGAIKVIDPRFRHAPLGFLSPLLRGQPALALSPIDRSSRASLRAEPAMKQVPDGHDDDRKIFLDATLDGAGDGDAEVKVREVLRGWPALEWREGLDRLAEDRVRQEFEQHTLGFYFPGASLTALKFGPRDADDQPFTVEYTFHAPRLARAEGKRLVIAAPYPALLGKRYVGMARRATPMQLIYTAPTEIVATFHLPPGATVGRRSDGIKASDPTWGGFTLATTATPDQLVVTTTFATPAGRVAPDRYQQFARFADIVDGAEAEAAEVNLK